MLTVALAKGRILKDTLPLFAAAGIEPEEEPGSSRRLIIGSNHPNVRFLLVRATDVPTYVEHGGADLGISGKDLLDEHGGYGMYEPLDLGIAKCKLMVASRVGEGLPDKPRLVVATKYVKATQDYFARLGRQVEIIKLYGSMEIAPLVGMADIIVDLVDTGNTLRANGLEPVAEIADISSRVVVNKVAMKLKHAEIQQLLNVFRQELNRRNAVAV